MKTLNKTELWQIEFHPFKTRLRLPAYTDRAIEVARQRLERLKQTRLPLSFKTGFPAFTVYRSGQEGGSG